MGFTFLAHPEYELGNSHKWSWLYEIFVTAKIALFIAFLAL